MQSFLPRLSLQKLIRAKGIMTNGMTIFYGMLRSRNHHRSVFFILLSKTERMKLILYSLCFFYDLLLVRIVEYKL